jgi:hypothetical protein
MAASTAPARCFATPNGASTNAAASTATIAETDFPGPERTTKDCYAVRFVSDCSSGVSQEAHEAGKQRMVQVGASGINWFGRAVEWTLDYTAENDTQSTPASAPAAALLASPLSTKSANPSVRASSV